MSSVAMLPAPPSLTDMYADKEAKVRDFFDALAEELPSPLSGICTRTGDLFITKHLRTRLGQLFRLTRKQAEDVTVEAGADQDEVPGFVASYEDAAGFEFRGHSVPESARLACHVASDTLATKGTASASWKRKSLPTIGQEVKASHLEFGVPECCYDVIETMDPLNNPISEPELEAFSTEVIQAVGTRFGRYNIGRPYARILGKEIEKKLPHLPVGKGKNRSWGKILNTKSKNRKNVRHSPPPPPPPAPPRARAHTPRVHTHPATYDACALRRNSTRILCYSSGTRCLPTREP